jgi:membrane glycosyltransferase
MKEHHEEKRGMSFLGTLTLIFIVLRLCNLIDWSWLWVLSPLLLSLLLGLVVAVIEIADEERKHPPQI